MADIPGITTSVEQPMAHLISAMLSGVQSQVAVKLYGDDLDILRAKAQEMKQAITGTPGVKDLMVEPQVMIPQLRNRIGSPSACPLRIDPRRRNQLCRNGHGTAVSCRKS